MDDREEPTPRDRPPRPILRASLTLTPPADPTSDLTLQVVVTSADDETIWSDLPESREAGWSTYLHKALEIHLRTIG